MRLNDVQYEVLEICQGAESALRKCSGQTKKEILLKSHAMQMTGDDLQDASEHHLIMKQDT